MKIKLTTITVILVLLQVNEIAEAVRDTYSGKNSDRKPILRPLQHGDDTYGFHSDMRGSNALPSYENQNKHRWEPREDATSHLGNRRFFGVTSSSSSCGGRNNKLNLRKVVNDFLSVRSQNEDESPQRYRAEDTFQGHSQRFLNDNSQDPKPVPEKQENFFQTFIKNFLAGFTKKAEKANREESLRNQEEDPNLSQEAREEELEIEGGADNLRDEYNFEQENFRDEDEDDMEELAKNEDEDLSARHDEDDESFKRKKRQAWELEIPDEENNEFRRYKRSADYGPSYKRKHDKKHHRHGKRYDAEGSDLGGIRQSYYRLQGINHKNPKRPQGDKRFRLRGDDVEEAQMKGKKKLKKVPQGDKKERSKKLKELLIRKMQQLSDPKLTKDKLRESLQKRVYYTLIDDGQRRRAVMAPGHRRFLSRNFSISVVLNLLHELLFEYLIPSLTPGEINFNLDFNSLMNSLGDWVGRSRNMFFDFVDKVKEDLDLQVRALAEENPIPVKPKKKGKGANQKKPITKRHQLRRQQPVPLRIISANKY